MSEFAEDKRMKRIRKDKKHKLNLDDTDYDDRPPHGRHEKKGPKHLRHFDEDEDI